MEHLDLGATDSLIEQLSGPRWTVAATVAMCQLPLKIRRGMVKAGKDEWLRVAKTKFHGQGFSQRDLLLMFQALTVITHQDRRWRPGILKGNIVNRVAHVMRHA